MKLCTLSQANNSHIKFNEITKLLSNSNELISSIKVLRIYFDTGSVITKCENMTLNHDYPFYQHARTTLPDQGYHHPNLGHDVCSTHVNITDAR